MYLTEKPELAYFGGLAQGWASRLEEVSKTTDNEGILQLIEDMKEEGKRLAKLGGVKFA